MRNAFANEMELIAERDERIVLLSGDIGNRLFDRFKERFPDRFLNCGVAEANMIGMAAGLAMAGLRPVVYTIASFLVFRPFEQIRIDIGYHNLPVVLVGVGGGLSYASNGPTHHSLEDVAVLRTIPNMQILNAGDAWEVRASLGAAIASDAPCYLRIGKKREPVIHAGPINNFVLGKTIRLREGLDASLLVSGNLLPTACDIADRLREIGCDIALYSSPSIRPMDEALLATLFDSGTPLFILEEHNRNGGLGTSILEWANDHHRDARSVVRIGAADDFLHRTTDQSDARECLGLTTEACVRLIRNTLSE